MRKLDINVVLDRFREVHELKYDYSEFIYYSSGVPSVVKCPMHGPWLVSYDNHFKRKSGCPTCGVISSTKARKGLVPVKAIEASRSEGSIQKRKLYWQNNYEYMYEKCIVGSVATKHEQNIYQTATKKALETKGKDGVAAAIEKGLKQKGKMGLWHEIPINTKDIGRLSFI